MPLRGDAWARKLAVDWTADAPNACRPDRGSEGYVLRLRPSACRDAGDLTGALEPARSAAELSDEDVDECFRVP
ncbi:hypothetical protein [Streptomyces sp. NPDC047042]|uniref:hypothetical protein n=1 Tax=Streptomyces sp. NPDC047042 TaxID=3154807 RepID=UPI0033FCCA30